jgi:hypothetical protein
MTDLKDADKCQFDGGDLILSADKGDDDFPWPGNK